MYFDKSLAKNTIRVVKQLPNTLIKLTCRPRNVLWVYIERLLATKQPNGGCFDAPPNRPRQVRFTIPSRFVTLAKSSLLMSVAIVPGRIALARMLYCPSATAELCIKDNIPALVGV